MKVPWDETPEVYDPTPPWEKKNEAPRDIVIGNRRVIIMDDGPTEDASCPIQKDFAKDIERLNNVLVGYQAGLSSGNENVAIGYQAGPTIGNRGIVHRDMLKAKDLLEKLSTYEDCHPPCGSIKNKKE